MRENSPENKRKRQVERKSRRLDPYKKILIVCEGKKTEPNYFKEIRQSLRLPTIYIVPTNQGTGPSQILESAIKEFYRRNSDIEYIYVVFDYDDKEDFFSAIEKAQKISLKNKSRKVVTVTAIPTLPCFELWILLHKKSVTSKIDKSTVEKTLNNVFPKYSKTSSTNYELTKTYLDVAYVNAEKLRNLKDKIGDKYLPYTDLDVLVRYLHDLKKAY